jgi:polyisoprenyl-teichoic acid--peptidoglycan teichoic acid transferase
LQKRRKRRIVLWSLVGFVVVVLAVAGGSYLWLNRLVGSTHTSDPGIEDAVGSTFEGSIGTPTGMDILVLGSDKRPTNEGEETRSDTVILIHADPEEDYLSMLSLPRDLRVEVPGHGIEKLNAAYAQGGPELTIQTVERLTNVDIEEYVQVDFQAFSDIVDSLDGVYLDIDRRYYNDNPEFDLIKISPGYQLLDGSSALDYVRFRNDSNYDFGRMDRQQRFITAVREQAMGWNLLLDLPGVVSALFGNLVTTLDTNQVLELAYWGAGLDGSRIRQVTVVGDIQERDGVSYVIPEEGAVEEAVQKLMTAPEGSAGDETTASGGSSEGGTDTTSPSSTTTTESTDSFVTDPDEIANSRLWSQLAAAAPFPVLAPGYLPEGYGYVDRMPVEGGAYHIVLDGDKTEPAIKMVYRLTNVEGTETDQYMGIMETTWLDAPAAGAGTQVQRNGITYTFVGTDQRTERIWWVKDDVLYWVSNTLSYVMNRTQLLQVAESMIEIPSGAGTD